MLTGTIAHGLRCKGYAYHAHPHVQGTNACVEDNQGGWMYWVQGKYWEEGQHNMKWLDAEGSLWVSGMWTW